MTSGLTVINIALWFFSLDQEYTLEMFLFSGFVIALIFLLFYTYELNIDENNIVIKYPFNKIKKTIQIPLKNIIYIEFFGTGTSSFVQSESIYIYIFSEAKKKRIKLDQTNFTLSEMVKFFNVLQMLKVKVIINSDLFRAAINKFEPRTSQKISSKKNKE